jgi:hypothetical protein
MVAQCYCHSTLTFQWKCEQYLLLNLATLRLQLRRAALLIVRIGVSAPCNFRRLVFTSTNSLVVLPCS